MKITTLALRKIIEEELTSMLEDRDTMDRPGRAKPDFLDLDQDADVVEPARAGTYRTSGGPQFRDWEDAGDMQRADLHDGNGRIHGRSDLQRADAARPRTAPSMGTGTSTSNAARRGRNVRRALGTAGRGARFLARQIPLVGAAMTIPSVARGDVHPAQWAAEQVPFLGTAMDLAQAAEEARPERAQEYERSYRTAMENPASRPFTIASQPPPRAMGTADTLRSWRPYRRVGPETGGGEAAWKRDDLNEQHIQQIIEAIMAIQGGHQ